MCCSRAGPEAAKPSALDKAVQSATRSAASSVGRAVANEVTRAVFGTSSGASILLNLLLRHPGFVRGAIVHEPLFEALIRTNGPAPVPT